VPVSIGSRQLRSPRNRAAVHSHERGDAHLSNFGGYASPERNLVFDLNDFDETLSAPWEWDLKRLVASIVVAGRSNGYHATDCADHAHTAVRAYRERMAQFAEMTNLAVWYTQISATDIIAGLTGAIKKEFERGSSAPSIAITSRCSPR
jgi:uncharacterized protein (DUF2252 family)